MRVHYLLACVVFLSLASPAQDWQECKPTGDYSFNDVKAAIHRVTSSAMYSGWDEKTFNRSGDLVAVAVLKTLDDSEMASPESAKSILAVIRAAFACPQKCVQVTDDRLPRISLLLLEHLNDITHGKMQAEIEGVKQYIVQQALTDPDKALFNRAKDAIQQKRFDVANLALQTLLNTYPTSEYTAEAKSLLQDPRIANCGQFSMTPEKCDGAAQTHPSH